MHYLLPPRWAETGLFTLRSIDNEMVLYCTCKLRFVDPKKIIVYSYHQMKKE